MHAFETINVVKTAQTFCLNEQQINLNKTKKWHIVLFLKFLLQLGQNKCHCKCGFKSKLEKERTGQKDGSVLEPVFAGLPGRYGDPERPPCTYLASICILKMILAKLLLKISLSFV